jgi:hypothetical protein
MTKDDEPDPKKPGRPRADVTIALASTVIVAGIGIWAVLDQRANTDRLAQELQSTQAALSTTQAALSTTQAENDALSSISLESFLSQYNAHVSRLKTAVDRYEKAKTAKGANVTGSDPAGALTHAEAELCAVSDNFTDFIHRWGLIAELLDKMLDGNVHKLENSRRENNTVDVDAMANRGKRNFAARNFRPHAPPIRRRDGGMGVAD